MIRMTTNLATIGKHVTRFYNNLLTLENVFNEEMQHLQTLAPLTNLQSFKALYVLRFLKTLLTFAVRPIFAKDKATLVAREIAVRKKSITFHPSVK